MTRQRRPTHYAPRTRKNNQDNLIDFDELRKSKTEVEKKFEKVYGKWPTEKELSQWHEPKYYW